MKTLLSIAVLAGLAVMSPAQTYEETQAQIKVLKQRLMANQVKIDALTSLIQKEMTADNFTVTGVYNQVPGANSRKAAMVEIANTLNTLETKLKFGTTDAKNMYITGANLEVRNGNSSLINGLGNLIVGYNPTRVGGNIRTGSHNLVFGNYANYSSTYGIVGGEYNELLAPRSVIMSGQYNAVTGADLFQAILTGIRNKVSSNVGAIVTGNDNNVSSSVRSIILTGSYNTVTGGYDSAIVTGESARIENSVRGAILTGYKTKISNATNAAIGTGQNLTLTSNNSFDAN